MKSGNLLKQLFRKWKYVHVGDKGTPDFSHFLQDVEPQSSLVSSLTMRFINFINLWTLLQTSSKSSAASDHLQRNLASLEVDTSFRSIRTSLEVGLRKPENSGSMERDLGVFLKKRRQKHLLHWEKAYLGEPITRWQENGNNLKSTTGKDQDLLADPQLLWKPGLNFQMAKF